MPLLLACDPKRALKGEGEPTSARPSDSARVSTPAPSKRGGTEAPRAALRGRLLSGKPVDFGIERPGPVWAVAMDMATDAGTATVMGLADGNASYETSTFGITGSLTHERVRDAAIRLCAVAARHLYAAGPAVGFPLPDPGQIHFHFLTPTGARMAAAEESALRSGADALFELFFAAHALISELSQIAESE